MIYLSRFCRMVLAACCGAALLLPAARAQGTGQGKAYTRVYVENRCYHTVELAVERPRGEMRLPPVPPRDTELVLFTWAGQVAPGDTVRLSRRDAEEKRVTAAELLDGAPQERWVMGPHVVHSRFVTLCGKERALDDPAGATFRPAQEGEGVAEYEMLFGSVPGSHDPMHIFSGYPVRVSLNGTPLHVLSTGKDGMLRFLLPETAAGTVTLEGAADETRTAVLGSEWRPVRVRRAKAGERLLVAPPQAGGPQDW